VGLSKAGRLTGQELSDKAVARLVKGAAEAAGLEGWERFSGHSLRAGLATAAGEAGADLAQVMRQTRHRSADVALGYLRPAWLCYRILGSPAVSVLWGRRSGAE
jgi:integrase